MITGPVLFTSFAGRDAEHGQLLTLWKRTAAEMSGSVVLMTGEAGVGKTRLLEEFRKTVARDRGLAVGTSCDESVQFAYKPVIALIDALTERRIVRDFLDLRSARRRLTEPMVQASDSHRAALADRYIAVTDAINDIAARAGALALIVDDLQWSDASSLDLFRYLARELRTAPLLLILSYRSDHADQRFAPALAKIERERVFRIRLGALSKSEIRNAIEAALDPQQKLSKSTIERITELAEGKPYFAEELLRNAIDSAANDREATLSAPTSLRAAVLQRVDALEPLHRDVVAHAAVVGRTFTADLVARLIETEPPVILRAFRAARNAQILREAEPGQFEFRHALAREILYGEFLGAETRLLHSRIADELDREDPRDSLLAEIAHHRWLAKDGARSAQANEAAGDEAFRLSAYADAHKHFRRALDTLERKSVKGATLCEKAAKAAIMIGDLENAKTDTSDAIISFRAAGDDLNARRVTLWSARQSHLRGEHEKALEIIAEVRSELRHDHSDDANLVAADIAELLVCEGRGDSTDAILRAERMLSSTYHFTDGDLFHIYHARGNARIRLNKYDEAISDFEHAERLAEGLSNTYRAIHSSNNRAAAAGLAGHYKTARSVYETTLARAQNVGITSTISILAANTAFWQVVLGDIEAARKNAKIAITRHASEYAVSLALSVQTRLAAITGDYSDRADERGIEALQRARALDDPVVFCIAAGAFALYLIARGKMENAAEIVNGAVGRVEEFGPSAFWILEATAVAGEQTAQQKLREILVGEEPSSDSDARRAYLALFDGILQSCRKRSGSISDARSAAVHFEETGLLYEAGRSYELSGDSAKAIATFKAMGAYGEVRRVEGSSTQPAQTKHASPLTRREEQIARLVASGLSNKDIADDLRISERTVETHVANAYEKLRVRTRAGITLYFAKTLGEG